MQRMKAESRNKKDAKPIQTSTFPLTYTSYETHYDSGEGAVFVMLRGIVLTASQRLRVSVVCERTG